MGGLLSTGNLARIAKVLALLFFVLPWVTVSCGEQTLATMSGVNLVTGNVQMTNAMPGATTPPAGNGELFVILGAVLILAALAASFVLKGTRGAMVGAAGSALAAASLLYGVLIRVKAQATTDVTAGAGESGGMNTQQIAEMVRVNIEIGFWLTILALVAAVVLNVLAMRGGSVVPAAATPPAPPPEAPPPAV